MKTFFAALALATIIGGSASNTISHVQTAIPMDRGDATLIARAGPTKDARYASGSSRMAGESTESR